MRRRGAVTGKASRLGGLFFFCLATHAAAEGAEPSPQLASGFAYVPGESGEVGCLPESLVDTTLQNVTEEVLGDLSLDPDFAIVLTAGVLTCPSIFYLPLKNDVSGIGHARQEESELFDRAPDHRLQGVAFLNDLPYWQAEPEEFESAFLHELGHRWLARVHATVDESDVDLTGRDGDHWSYFLDSGGSPLEGNAWSDAEIPVADSPTFPKRYSPLDLYLMGAYEPDEVPELRLLVPDDHGAEDCSGGPLGPASPPQSCEPLAVAGTWLPVTVEDVVAAEGPRVPTAADAPKSFSVAFLLLDPGGVGFDAERCEELARWTERLIELFGEATDGRLALENAVVTGTACADLEWAAPPPASGCQVGRGASTGLQLAALASLGGLLAAVAARRARRPG